LMIYFQPASGRPSWAISDKNGHFVLDYDPDYDGAVIGNHTVWVLENPNASDPLLTQGKPKQKRSPEMQALLDKYGSVEKSPYKVEVKKTRPQFSIEARLTAEEWASEIAPVKSARQTSFGSAADWSGFSPRCRLV